VDNPVDVSLATLWIVLLKSPNPAYGHPQANVRF
jgi:hypothetical protein